MATVSIGSFILAVAFLVTGLYVYRTPRLERLRRYPYFSYAPGAFFSLFPLGIAFLAFGFFPLVTDKGLALTLFWLSVLLVLVAAVLWAWSPRWTRPYWLRDDQPD